MALAGWLKGKGSVLVACSGGVDSSVLAKAAYDVLGDDALAVTFDTPAVPRREIKHAVEAATSIGIRHLTVGLNLLEDEDFIRNPENRCYFCKRLMASRLKEMAADHGLSCVVEGTTVDELQGHRPGYRALQEAGVLSPYVELGMSKDDVRALAAEYGIKVRPSGACLATRVPSGVEVTEELLRRVEDSEDYLRSLGLEQVRVRVEGDNARIETLISGFGAVLEHADEINDKLQFNRVSLDLRGYS